MTNKVYCFLFLSGGSLLFDNKIFALVFSESSFQPDFRIVAKMSLKTQTDIFVIVNA